ncbi:MAG: rolling circle replication-associated protein [Actinomycetota bacterium]
MPKRWNRFRQALRRERGFDVAYFRTIETQVRFALHEHILLASRDRSQPFVVDLERIRRTAMEFGYGHSIKLERTWSSKGSAGYVAKYVSKACDDRPEVPWIDLETGEIIRARYRPWSASRDWGLQMRAVLEAQRAWAQALEAQALDNKTKNYTTFPVDALSSFIGEQFRGAGIEFGGGS